MKFELKMNKLILKPKASVALLMPYFRDALDAAEDKLIEFMWSEIDKTSSAPKTWRDNLKDDLKHLSEQVFADRITYEVGTDYSPKTGLWMRAMVIAYGMGSHGMTGVPVYAGPYGRTVWDNQLLGTKPSDIPTVVQLPDSWNHLGRNYVENAVRQMQAIYSDYIEQAMQNVPPYLLNGAITISAGR